MCEGIRVEITKKVRERDEDEWEGRRKGRETVGMKGNRKVM